MSKIELSLKQLMGGNYVKFGYYTSKDENKVKKFNIYLRNNKKILIDADKVITCDKYKYFFIKTYLIQLFNKPDNFVIYKTGIGWTSESSELQEWQVSDERFFPCYMKSLFTKSEIQNCIKCPAVGIHCYCNHCSVGFCIECFIKLRDYYIPYQDWFKCPNCKEINCL